MNYKFLKPYKLLLIILLIICIFIIVKKRWEMFKKYKHKISFFTIIFSILIIYILNKLIPGFSKY